MKEILLKLRLELFFQLDKKPSWGTKELKDLFILTMNNVLLDHTEFDKDEGKKNNSKK